MSKPNFCSSTAGSGSVARAYARCAAPVRTPDHPGDAEARERDPDGEHRCEELLAGRRLDGARHGGRQEVAHAVRHARDLEEPDEDHTDGEDADRPEHRERPLAVGGVDGRVLGRVGRRTAARRPGSSCGTCRSRSRTRRSARATRRSSRRCPRRASRPPGSGPSRRSPRTAGCPRARARRST